MLAILSTVALSVSVCPRLRVPFPTTAPLAADVLQPSHTHHSLAYAGSAPLAVRHTPDAAHQAVQPAPGLMKLRGGMSLGPLNPGNFEGGMKVAAAITAAGAVTSKYAESARRSSPSSFRVMCGTPT